MASEAPKRCRRQLQHPSLRMSFAAILAGVELGGALKNVLAIACGISDGLGFGNNGRAALITRGLAEMTRLAVAAGERAHRCHVADAIALVSHCHYPPLEAEILRERQPLPFTGPGWLLISNSSHVGPVA